MEKIFQILLQALLNMGLDVTSAIFVEVLIIFLGVAVVVCSLEKVLTTTTLGQRITRKAEEIFSEDDTYPKGE